MSRTLFWYFFKDLLRIFLLASGALAGIMSFGGLLRPLTEHTVVEPGLLDGLLGTVARDGYARQCGEVRADRGCLAAPVRDPATGGLVAGLALCGPAARVAEPNAELVALLREHAERLVPLLS